MALLHQDGDGLVHEFCHHVCCCFVKGYTVPVKRNNINVWKHRTATYTQTLTQKITLQSSIHHDKCICILELICVGAYDSHGQCHFGQHLSPLTSTAKPTRPQFGGLESYGQLWDLLNKTSWPFTQMSLVHSSITTEYGGYKNTTWHNYNTPNNTIQLMS